MKLKLGPKLLQERENRKMTQAEFAELLGMSQSTYARLERNESKADLEQIVKIAEVCNIPLQEFLPDFLSFYNQHNEAPSTIVLGKTVNNIKFIYSLHNFHLDNCLKINSLSRLNLGE